MTTFSTKKRKLPFMEVPRRAQLWANGIPVGTTNETIKIVGDQETRSQGNRYHLLGRSDSDVGGNFFTKKNFFNYLGTDIDVTFKDMVGSNQPVAVGLKFLEPSRAPGSLYLWDGIPLTSPSGSYVNIGPQFPVDVRGTTNYPVIPEPSNNYLDAMGTTAINRTIPTKSDANLAAFIGELKEGLPHLVGHDLWKSRLTDIRSAGSEYLNVQFGWKPLVSDIRKFCKALSNADKILAQLERDSGKNVRRKYSFPPENSLTTSVSSGVFNYPAGANGQSSKSGTLTTVSQKSVNVRFSGCYVYHLDSETRNRVKAMALKADHLLGIRLTPDVLWELAPWSWLVDYFGNVGDVMSNISEFSHNDLVLRYGYIMHEETRVNTYTWTGDLRINGIWKTVSLSCSMGTILKVRRKATPYGFGLDLGSLSDSQWAILVALGIARAPKML